MGRSSRRAYAYLTFRKDKVLSEISQKRLDAIREFTEFGSGFRIAMRDLELRGAGNLLGARQHGHMADVGYDMYMKLLGQAVSAAKGEAPAELELDCQIDLPVEAHIPESYIENLSRRLEIYRRIADIRNENDASDVVDELIDRFGDIPQALHSLIDIALLRNRAQKSGIHLVRQQGDTLQLYVRHLQSDIVGDIITRMKGRAVLNVKDKPYISIRLRSGETALALLNTLIPQITA